MEIPDVLVVTKADLGDVALRARRDLHAALRSLGRARRRGRRGLVDPAAVSGIDELVAALDAHRAALDLAAAPRWPRAARARWRTSSPSTASAGCARSAAGAPAERARRAGPGRRRPGAVGGPRGRPGVR